MAPREYKHKSNIHHLTDTNLLNLNGDVLCAVDILMTGPDPRKDQIYEICVLPLNSHFKPHAGIVPFHILFQPDINKIDLDKLPKSLTKSDIYEAVHKGTHPYIIADRFEEWYAKIHLRERKRICVLSYDWILKSQFIINWLGILHYNQFFSYAYRDLLTTALYINDKCDYHSEVIRYPKYDLQYLFSQSGVEGAVGKYDTMMNCISIAECYKRMLKDLY